MYAADDQPRSYGAVCICKEFEEVMLNQIRLLAYEIFQRNVCPDEVHNWHRAERMLISYLLAKAGPFQWLRDDIQDLRKNQRKPDADSERLCAQITRLEEQLQERDSRISRLVAAFQERCERNGSKRGQHGLAQALLRQESGASERESWQKDMEALLLRQRQELAAQSEQLVATESRHRESEVVAQTQHSELEARSQQLMLRDEHVKQLEGAFQVQHTELQASLQQLERRTKREKDLIELEAAGHQRTMGLQAKSKQLEEELATKSAEMEALSAQLKERDEKLQQHEASVADRESRVRDLEEQLNAKTRSSSSAPAPMRRQETSELPEECDVQKPAKDLSEVITRLHALQAEVAEKNTKLEKATRHVARLEEQLEDRVSTRSRQTSEETMAAKVAYLEQALDTIVEVQRSRVQEGEAGLQAPQKEAKARPPDRTRQFPEEVLSQMHRNRMGTPQSRMTPSRRAAEPLAALAAGRMTPVKKTTPRDSLQAAREAQRAPAHAVDSKTEVSLLQSEVRGGSSSTLVSLSSARAEPRLIYPIHTPEAAPEPLLPSKTWTSALPSAGPSRAESSTSVRPSQAPSTPGPRPSSQAIQEAIEILSKSAGAGAIQETEGDGMLNILGLAGKEQLGSVHLDEIKDRVRRARQQRYIVSPPAALRGAPYGYA